MFVFSLFNEKNQKKNTLPGTRGIIHTQKQNCDFLFLFLSAPFFGALFLQIAKTGTGVGWTNDNVEDDVY